MGAQRLHHQDGVFAAALGAVVGLAGAGLLVAEAGVQLAGGRVAGAHLQVDDAGVARYAGILQVTQQRPGQATTLECRGYGNVQQVRLVEHARDNHERGDDAVALRDVSSLPQDRDGVIAMCRGPLATALRAKVGEDLTHEVLKRISQVLVTGNRAGTEIPIDLDLEEDDVESTMMMPVVWHAPVSVVVVSSKLRFAERLVASLGDERVYVSSAKDERELRKLVFSAQPLLVVVNNWRLAKPPKEPIVSRRNSTNSCRKTLPWTKLRRTRRCNWRNLKYVKRLMHKNLPPLVTWPIKLVWPC